ncbi:MULTISPECIES: methylglyoxal synthase [Brevibacillus]|uniref:Methylglyoxal synthase n=1 Tax=Brevibacillus laterosporus TaxID=1465 RepID=A0AAP3DK27_BRELA|nr:MULTISPECIES: methylglyoxal synthase [Brevibacillus]ATO51229.1 methylglyoxal synthase [Brevibacillus laterosporus DSM 25]AYB38629.1 methylglyoxal synthase [Brevibacillus laterosporus]MBG9771999.1 methylglyoxal synthase [Brevibacillus laterosporus]MBG9790824.1 methylglyoxal synthase [Brevibacillus laterosporus]MBG9797387.1 methylglyoxal synthase [Brevibacillus laterosporus]
MNIALIAHDQKKEEMVQLAMAYEGILQKHQLFTTGTTGLRIMENTRLQVTRFLSGPLGGDQQIGAMIAKNEMDVIVFLRDPLTSQPHEPDIQALLRLCDVHRIPVATNLATAEILLKAVEQGNMAWREV